MRLRQLGSRSTFVPGHGQKLRIQLEQRVGGLLVLRDLVEELEEHLNGGTTAEVLSSRVRTILRASPEDRD